MMSVKISVWSNRLINWIEFICWWFRKWSNIQNWFGSHSLFNTLPIQSAWKTIKHWKDIIIILLDYNHVWRMDQQSIYRMNGSALQQGSNTFPPNYDIATYFSPRPDDYTKQICEPNFLHRSSTYSFPYDYGNLSQMWNVPHFHPSCQTSDPVSSSKLKTFTDAGLSTYSTQARTDIGALSSRWYKPSVFHDANYDVPKNTDSPSRSHRVPECAASEEQTITCDLDPVVDETGKLLKPELNRLILISISFLIVLSIRLALILVDQLGSSVDSIH